MDGGTDQPDHRPGDRLRGSAQVDRARSHGRAVVADLGRPLPGELPVPIRSSHRPESQGHLALAPRLVRQLAHRHRATRPDHRQREHSRERAGALWQAHAVASWRDAQAAQVSAAEPCRRRAQAQTGALTRHLGLGREMRYVLGIREESVPMATWKPDPSFYPSPRMAMKAEPETLAYVAAFDPNREKPDAIAVVDVDPKSKSYSEIIGTVEMPNAGDELHHFGWNACSSCLCPNAPHPHAERRYLVVPGLRSSRIHILDTKPNPKKPKIVKVIEPEEVADKAGYTRPHTVHCGPEGIYVAALGNREGKGPGGVFLMDHETFDVRGQWEMDRGPQQLAYDVWWHLGHDTLVTSEWGTPDTFENGLIPEVLLGAKYGHRLHFWDLHKRKHLQTV